MANSEIEFMYVNVEVSGSANNIAGVSSSDIEVYFEMPSEPGTYTLPLHTTITGHPFVSVNPDHSSVVVTVVEANQ